MTDMKYSNRLAEIFNHSVSSEKIIIDYLHDNPDVNVNEQVIYDLKKHQENIGQLIKSIYDELKYEEENKEL